MAMQSFKRKRINIPLTDRKKTRPFKNLAINQFPPTDRSDKWADDQERTAELVRVNETKQVEITERKRAEETLKKENTGAQRFLDIAGVMLVAINPDQKVILINRKGCEILGYKQEEAVGKNWFDTFLPERERNRVKEFFVKLISGEVEPIEYFENPILTRNGEERMVAWHNTLLKDENGNILGTLSSGEDITERKRVEKEMHDNEERLQTLMNASPMGISWAGLEGNIQYTNKKFYELFGYTIEDIPTIAEWRRLAYPDPAYRETVPSLLTMLHEAQKHKIEFTPIEVTITCKNGSIRYVEQMGALAADRILVVYKDITERKLAETALRRSEDTARRLAKENAIKAEIGRIISSSLNIDEVYDRFSEEVRKLIPFDRSSINLINPKDNTITFAYVTGVDIPGRQTGDTIPLIGSPAEECLRTRSTLLIQPNDDADVVSRFPGLSKTLQEAGQSMIFVPLITKDQVIGVLFLRAPKHNHLYRL